jgi:hypothetical protein
MGLPENIPHIGASSLSTQTTGYDPLDIKLRMLFGIDEEGRRQRLFNNIQFYGGLYRPCIEKEYVWEYFHKTNTQEWSVAQNPNRQKDLEYITCIGEDKDNPMYAGIIQLEDCCKQQASKNDYQHQRGGKSEQKKQYDPIANDTLDVNNAFDVERAFLQALIGKAKQQIKQQEMYPTPYLT